MKFINILIALATTAVVPTVLADCCTDDDHDGVCTPGHAASPCCGVKGCNIFCCQCEGGCWGANAKERSVPVIFDGGSYSSFKLADRSGTGTLSKEDYFAHMNVTDDADGKWAGWFDKHDKNGDGVVSLDELRLPGN